MSIAKQVLTPAQTREATAFFTANATAHVKGAEKWASIRAMFVISGIVIDELKAALATLNRDTWLTLAEKKKGSPLDAEETKRIRNVANADFSRGVADPVEKERKAQAAATKKANADAALKQKLLDDAKAAAKGESDAVISAAMALAPPSTIRSIEEVRDQLNKVSADLIAFQAAFAKSRTPTQEKAEMGESLGRITQDVVTALDAVVAMLPK